MAQRIITSVVDDIDGTEGADTVTFALDGIGYEIDLSEKNSAALRKALAKYVEHARKTGKARPATSKGSGSKGASKNTGEAAAIRQWAKDNGHAVPDRGRIPEDVRAAYFAANPAAA